MRRIDAVFTAIVLTIVTLGFAPAVADDGEPCVPQEAWTQTIEHPAVTHEEMTDPGQPYIAPTEGQWSDGEWYNWTGGPSEEAPDFDADGWHGPLPNPPNGAPHNAEPGVYNVSKNDNGLGSWFKHTAEWIEGTPGQPYIAPTYETVVDEEAWTETIEHEAVTCDEEEPPVDECLGENGEDLCVHEEPEPPVDNDPEPPVDSDEPKGYRETKCLAGALVTKNYDAQGNTVSTSTENGHPRCAPVDGEVFKEEGM